MQKFTNQDLLSDFRKCESEIVNLRNQNKELSIEVNAMNRVLHAVNSHREESKSRCATEDIIYEIRGTIKCLEGKIKDEKES